MTLSKQRVVELAKEAGFDVDYPTVLSVGSEDNRLVSANEYPIFDDLSKFAELVERELKQVQ